MGGHSYSGGGRITYSSGIVVVGGGYNNNNYTYYNNSTGCYETIYNRRHNNTGDNDDCCSCCIPSSSSSSHSHSSSSSSSSSSCSKFFWLQVLVLTLMIAYGLILYFTYPKARSDMITLGLSETRIVPFRKTWYTSLDSGTATFEDTTGAKGDASANITLLKFASTPPLTASDSWSFNGSIISVDPRDTYYMSWYFYGGSTLQVSLPDFVPCYIYLVRGDKGYDNWHSDSDFSEYKIMTISPYYNKQFIVSLDYDDFYYLIFDNTNSYSSFSTVLSYQINSKLLDMSKNVSSCTLPCTMSVKYGSTEILVFQTPRVSDYLPFGTPNTEFSVHPYYHSRVSVIALLFSLPLGFMFLLFVFLLVKGCKKPEDMSRHVRPEDLNDTNINTNNNTNINNNSGIEYPTKNAVLDNYGTMK